MWLIVLEGLKKVQICTTWNNYLQFSFLAKYGNILPWSKSPYLPKSSILNGEAEDISFATLPSPGHLRTLQQTFTISMHILFDSLLCCIIFKCSATLLTWKHKIIIQSHFTLSANCNSNNDTGVSSWIWCVQFPRNIHVYCFDLKRWHM